MKMISRFAIILSIFHLNNVYSQEFTISKTDHLAYEVRDLNKVGDFFLNIFKFEEIEIDNPSLRWFDIGDGFEIHYLPTEKKSGWILKRGARPVGGPPGVYSGLYNEDYKSLK